MNAASNASFRFGVVILAAGPSTRMGKPKQMLSVNGTPLLARAVEAALASQAWPVIVVLGANAEIIRPTLATYPVIIAENAAWAEGMASSIRAGFDTLHQFSRAIDAGMIALCDQPAFSAEVIDRIVATHRDTGRSIVAAHYAGRAGAPALFTKEHFPALCALTGEAGARALLDRDPSQVATIELPELAFDLDTPADYAALSPKKLP